MHRHRLFNTTPLGARCALAAALLLTPLASHPATSTTSFGVTATVVSTCGISASTLAFGVYVLGQTDGTGLFSVTCTMGTAYTVSLDAGTGVGASVAVRRMTGPAGQTLNYSLYQDAARTTSWGDTVGVNTAAGTGSGSSQAMTVYGRIPAAQPVGAGNYTDTILITLTY